MDHADSPMPDPEPISDSTSGAPSGSSLSRDPLLHAQARNELVRQAYRQLTRDSVASSGAAAAFALLISLHLPSQRIWGWLGYMIVVTALCAWLAFSFARQPKRRINYARWSWMLIGATASIGLGWGASTWIFPTLENTGPIGVVHVLFLAGMASAATRLPMPVSRGGIAFLAAVMLPLAARFISRGELSDALVGVGVVAFLLYLASIARRNQRVLADALIMRTERDNLAAAVQSQNKERELGELQLREARERAESAGRAKADFLATISHEIRTPMNGVLGMLRIVRETPLTPEQRDYLKTASDSAETLLLLLNDVLDFSKIEAGRLELQSAPFAPALTARAVADLTHARARDKGLQFELHMDDHIPSVVIGDSNRLRQILVNLIGNAVKFTERGRVDLSVACHERTDTSVVLHFTVTDTGIGIDSTALDRLFKPFTQADNSMARRYGGTGLGLAISVRLAQAMGGLLQVKSALNQGTTFRLILPCKLPEAVTSAQLEDGTRFVTPALRGRVLVVEDDSVNRQVMELFLKKMRVSPKFAHDGESAVKLAAAETFDIILMDCQLPGIDGMETTRQIRRKLEGGRPLKIIALTANTSRQVRDACLQAGMDDFLTKPVRLEYLVDVLQRNLPGR
jgi:signal transduction histidine kinase/ActR/RegA family two-component response regulator